MMQAVLRNVQMRALPRDSREEHATGGMMADVQTRALPRRSGESRRKKVIGNAN